MEESCWRIKNNLCRCCHTQGDFINLAETTNIFNECGYARMILDCLNISIVQVPGELLQLTYSICEQCIFKLKDVASFKKQVLDCELRFVEMLSRKLVVADIVKEDIKDSEDFDIPPKLRTRQQIKRQPKKKGATRNSPPKLKQIPPIKQLNSDDELSSEGEEKSGKLAADTVFKNKRSIKGIVRFSLRESDYTTSADGSEYTCTRCNKRFNFFNTLRYHVKYNYYINRYQCPKCPEVFKTKVPFIQHKLREHDIDDRFFCNACDKLFNYEVLFKRHMDIFHMLGPKIKCSKCDFETFSMEGLYRHKFKHRTTKDFHCRFCKKKFLRRATLRLHERIHTGDKRKVCSVCGQAFVQKASLNYHMTKYHPNVN